MLRNGKIYTADPARSIRQSIAFKGNTIIAVGDDKDVTPMIGGGTKVMDLGRKLVLTGLIDTHIHPVIGALNGAKCSLAGAKAAIDALKPVVQDCLGKDQGGADDWFEAAQLAAGVGGLCTTPVGSPSAAATGPLLVQSVLRLSDRRYANWRKGTKAAQH